MLPQAQLDEYQRLADAATPPPWVAEWDFVSGNVPDGRPNGEVILRCRFTVARLDNEKQNKSNAAFIAAARLAVPALLDAMRELQNRCDQLTDDNRLFQTELASAMDQIHSG